MSASRLIGSEPSAGVPTRVTGVTAVAPSAWLVLGGVRGPACDGRCEAYDLTRCARFCGAVGRG